LMWISPKPMADGFVKIFDEFRNGCDEKSATFPRQCLCFAWVTGLKPGAFSASSMLQMPLISSIYYLPVTLAWSEDKEID